MHAFHDHGIKMVVSFSNNSTENMKKINIVNISAMNRDSSLLGRRCEETTDLPISITVHCEDAELTDDDEKAFFDLMATVRKADLIIMRFHGDPSHFKKYYRMLETVEKLNIDMVYDCSVPELNEENRFRFKHSDEELKKVLTYMEIGGDRNHDAMLRWICRNIGDADIEVPDPVFESLQGLYRNGKMFTDGLGEYVKDFDPNLPTIGVMMHNTTWSKKKTQPIDDLIRKLRDLGANVVAFFFTSTPNDVIGGLGVRSSVETYFYLDGKSIVDTVIITSGFSQIALSNPDNGSKDPSGIHNFFADLSVPVIQAPLIFRSIETWKEDTIGMTAAEVASGVIWPEFDGQIISVPLSFNTSNELGEYVCRSIEDRVNRISTLAVAWAKLRMTPPNERKIAVIFHMYPPTNDRIGGAAGLDSFESVKNCLVEMDKEGYVMDRVPTTGKEILDEILAGLTTDFEWVPKDEIEKRAADLIGLKKYIEWYNALTDKARAGIVHSWGDPPGIIATHEDQFIVPGVRNGNIFIGIQPNRGQHDQAETLYHDPTVVMPHAYLAYYRWLKYDFKADCIIHMGTHGTLEWLPGKGNGLSADCYPDVVLDTMPNVYPYIIDDPGEGVQCKRRINSVLIGHMCPTMTRADSYDYLSELDGKLQEYLNSDNTGQYDKKIVIADDIYRIVKEKSLFKEVGLDPECSVSEVAEKSDLIYDYVSDLKDALIKDGLHILGEVPEGDLMDEMIYSLCRLRNGNIPSLRSAIASSLGFNLDDLLNNPSGKLPDSAILNGELIDDIDLKFRKLLTKMRLSDFDIIESENSFKEIGKINDDVGSALSYVCDFIYPNVLKMTDELTNCMLGIAGRYVPPGPSGSPTRGNAHLLPMGTNFYSIDPDAIPTEASWRVGKKMADDMVGRYVNENGIYPENVGIIVWATDTMKTCGDDVAYIFSLMGIQPTWGAVGGKITGMEVIPLSELGRPRIDVTARISGLFRDSFPGIVNMIYDAVGMISELDESEESNYFKKHLSEDIRKFISEGMSPADARKISEIRIFGDPPGQHGTGVDVLIASSKWDSIDQIAQTFTTWGCYAYGGKWRGEKVPEAFKKRMGTLNVTVKNHNDREYDLLDIDDDYAHLGGMNAAVRVYGGYKPYSVMGDSSDVDRLKTRTLEEETSYVMRSRVLNPKWLDGLKRHGYKGAMELSKLTEYILGWGATSDSIEPWMYEEVSKTFILDQETRDWVNENNPYAMKEMIEDMLEAIERNLWDAPKEMKEKLQELYLDSESNLEELGSTK
jgi:cobaltochelatase CobN